MKNKKPTKPSFWTEQGVTLVEIVVVIFLLTTFSIVLMEVFVTHGRITTVSLKTSEMHLQRAAIERELKGVTRIATRVISSHTIDGTLYTSDSQTIIFQLPSLDLTGKPVTDTFDYAVFHLASTDPSELLYSQKPDAASTRHTINKLLSDKVETINFVYDHADLEDTERVIANIGLKDTFLDTSEEVNINVNLKLGNRLYE